MYIHVKMYIPTHIMTQHIFSTIHLICKHLVNEGNDGMMRAISSGNRYIYCETTYCSVAVRYLRGQSLQHTARMMRAFSSGNRYIYIFSYNIKHIIDMQDMN